MRKPFYLLAVLIWIGAALTLSGASAQTASDNPNADLEKRLQRLEEQMVDLGAQLGTVETLARGGGGAAPSSTPFSDGGLPSSGGSDGDRVADLETKLRAISAQMSDILRASTRWSGARAVSPPRRSPMMPHAISAPRSRIRLPTVSPPSRLSRVRASASA
ncbi:MAG: hypothetical protein HC850_16875, partial [Rhodomicrobium sp.]|nr:hypothetical protein [Rhodomicrobium sp.]